jgi:ATP-dependent exoDNAse (exonuclease V) beta subunit
MDWVVHSPEEVLDGVKIREAEEERRGRPRLAFVEKKVFAETFPSLEPRPVEHILKSAAERAAIANQANQIFEKLRPREKVFPKVIDLPVSAYAAFEKNPEDYKRIYEIGYPSWFAEDHEMERGAAEEEASAADFGVAMHGLLEHLDFKNPKVPPIGNLRNFFRGIPEEKIKEVPQMLESFFQSPLFARLRQAKILKRELPFLLNERHGLLYGVIDLLYQDPLGAWHLLDYKTAVGSPEKIKETGYDLQIQLYGLAARTILHEAPVTGTLYFLKNQWEYRIVFGKDYFKNFAERFRSIQQEVIAFRNQWEGVSD